MSRKKFRKCFGVLLLVASIIVASIPTSDSVAEETNSVASDFQLNGNTLVKYTGTATTVSVPDTVKVIGESAFANNSYIKTVKLPDTLKTISYAAFSGCNNLQSVVIPSNVEEIGNAAFANCKELTSFSLGESTKKIGTGLFVGCSKLSSISGNDYYVCDNGVIYDDEKETLYEVLQNAKTTVKKDDKTTETVNITKYVMPDSVTSIEPYAFYGCKNIEEISLSTNLNEIPAYSFSYCNGLIGISIPYSVHSIDVKAFEYCINLENVDIPVSVSFIHDTAFDGCPKLVINAPSGSYASKWYENFDRSEVNIIETEENEIIKDVSGNPIDLGANVVRPIDGLIGETIIVGRQAVFFIDNTKQTVISGAAVDNKDYSDIIKDMESVLQEETNGKGLSLPKFAILDNVISGKAFYADSELTEYTIPKNITSIGDFAFARSSLTSITIPENVQHIGYGAFYHCDNLSTILVPSTVADIEPSAFDNTRMMQNWIMYGENEFLIMGDGILVAYKGNKSVINIPEGVKQIGAEVFKGKTNIKEINVPDSVWRICEGAFMNCSNLRNVTGGMNVEVIEDRAFYGCPITTVRLVDSVRKIGLGAFSLDDTYADEANRVVVFQGDNLPLVSYNKTTSRLTNTSYRKDALSGVNVAIVNSENVNRLNSVLDRNESGFSGFICVISEPHNEYSNGTLRIIDCTLTKQEAENFNVQDTVYIYGKGYNFNKEQLSAVLQMAREGAYYSESDEEQTLISFPGVREKLNLEVRKDSYENISLKDAYKRIYGDTVPGNFTTYTVFLTSVDSGVRITKFGKQYYTLSIPLPDNMPTTNLHIICLDEYNQLEDLPYSVNNKNGVLTAEFDINHTGYYGIYSFNSTAVSKYNLDESPDTGDPIHPKWFLSIGLCSLGLALLLIRGKESDNKSVKTA